MTHPSSTTRTPSEHLTPRSGQMKHSLSFAFENHPSLHVTQTADPRVAAALPGAHPVHSVTSPPVLMKPSLHCMQTEDDTSFVNFPASHRLHVVLPSAIADFPVRQAKHVVEAVSFENVPAASSP